MRIGIITLPFNTNYGGILQSYALQTVLQRQGHEVSILDLSKRVQPNLPWRKVPAVIAKRVLYKYFLNKYRSPLLYERALKNKLPEIERNTRRFIKDYLNIVDVDNFYDLKSDNFDAIVVGSDQVWRPRYFPNFKGAGIVNAYLDFAANWDIKRISYAASFGTSDWEYSPELTETCKSLIKRFDLITVREEDAVKLLNDKFEIDSQVVLDPTLLLETQDYCKLIDIAEADGRWSADSHSKDFMMSYILDENTEIKNLIDNLAQYNGLTVRKSKAQNVSTRDFETADIKKYIQPPIEEWLRDFRDCKIVITDSFHACVFSIIFHKPFLVLGNEKRGLSRLESLLSMFGLQERLVNSHSDIYSLINRPIDYENVTTILDSKRNECLALIERYLKNG